jgi:hypothetical protein
LFVCFLESKKTHTDRHESKRAADSDTIEQDSADKTAELQRKNKEPAATAAAAVCPHHPERSLWWLKGYNEISRRNKTKTKTLWPNSETLLSLKKQQGVSEYAETVLCHGGVCNEFVAIAYCCCMQAGVEEKRFLRDQVLNAEHSISLCIMQS